MVLGSFVKELPWEWPPKGQPFPLPVPTHSKGTAHGEAGGRLYPLSAKGPARFPSLVPFPACERQGEVLNCMQGGIKPCWARAVFSKQDSPSHGPHKAAGWSQPPDNGQPRRVLLPSCTPCSGTKRYFSIALGSWKVKPWSRRAHNQAV